MATQSALPSQDMTPGTNAIGKMNLYGVDDSEREKALEASNTGLAALRARYENPNYFKIAAAFAKPQLGGFMASLGSAAEVMGENVEQQRANEIPIFNASSQNSAMRVALAQKANAAGLVANHKGPVTEELLKQVVARVGADSPLAQAIKSQLEGERANQGILQQQQTLRQSQGTQALQLVQQQFASGAINRDDYQRRLAAIEETYSPTQPVTPTRPIGAPGTTTNVEGASVAPPGSYADESKLKAIAGISDIAFDKAKEIAATEAMLPTLNPEDKKNAIAYISDLKSSETKPKKEKVVITSPLASDQSGLPPEDLRIQVTANETPAKARFDALEKIAGPTYYEAARSVLNDQMALIRDNPKLAKRVTAVLSQGNLASQIGTALEKGIGLNVAGVGAQIRLPVEDTIRAGFNKDEQNFAQALVNNYNKITIYQQKLNSVNPNAASNAETKLYNGVVPTLDTTPNAALRAMGHLRIELDAAHAQYKFVNDVYRNKNPDITLAKNVPDRYSAIFSDPSYAAVYAPFTLEHNDLSSAFQKRFSPTNKKP